MSKKYLLDSAALNSVIKKIIEAKNILLFLDYDGTLAPFQKDPLTAFALPKIEKSLNKIAEDSRFYLNLVSGRKLQELKKMITVPQSNYAGSHGLELDIFFEKEPIYPHKNREISQTSRENYQKVKEKYKKLAVVDLEDKAFGLALHFDSEQKQQKSKKELLSLFENSDYQVLSGRKIIEIRPKGWNKGRAVNYLSAKIKKEFNLDKPLRIYLGDDKTDEDAFKVIKNGITVYVQNESDLKTEADFYLKNPEETAVFLERLAGEL